MVVLTRESKMSEQICRKSYTGRQLKARGNWHLKQNTYFHKKGHWLSIEEYRVTPELIESVRSGDWNPDQNENLFAIA